MCAHYLRSTGSNKPANINVSMRALLYALLPAPCACLCAAAVVVNSLVFYLAQSPLFTAQI